MVIKKITENCFESLTEVKPYEVLGSLKRIEFMLKYKAPHALINSINPKRVFHKVIERKEFERYSRIMRAKLL